MTRRRLVTLIVLLVATLVAVGLLRRGPRPTPVDLDTVRTRDVLQSIVTASGEIVAVRYAEIGSTVMGRIVELPVSEGDRVRAGQLLARLDAVPARSDAEAAAAATSAIEAERAAAADQQTAARADLARARARSVEATTALARAEALSRQGLSPAADLDAARAAADAATADVAAAEAAVGRAGQALAAATRRIAQARAQQARAEDVLEKTEIRAPIDGVVSRLQVRQGEMVVIGIQNQPGTTLMTISDLAQVNAEVKVAEADVLRLAIGQPATVVLEALPGRSFPGRVVEVGASALPVVGTGAAAREFRVRVRLDEPDPGLRPGLTCDADILADERRNVTTVPLQAVVLREGPGGGQQSGVFVVRDDRAVFTPVGTGIIGGLDVEVSGLPPGASIVVGPFQTLRELADGAAVRAATTGR